MRLIDADVLYERIKADEELARDRVIDTPNSFPNGAVNPSAIRYMAQLCERTRFKGMVFDAPTIDPVKHGKWISVPHKRNRICSVCESDEPYKFADENANVFEYCPHCGTLMDGE